MKKLVEFIVQSIVDHPKEVKLEEVKEEGGLITLSLNLHQDDIGKVIGKEGKIIRAIRSLVHILAIKKAKRVNLEITQNSEKRSSLPTKTVREGPG